MKYFMIDIETMGVDEVDDIIQIGILELDQAPDGTYTPGRTYERMLHTSQTPKNDWIATHHKDKLPVCKRLPKVTPDNVRDDLLTFFWRCGAVGQVNIMGLNVTTFDLPFLLRAGYLKNSDYHYRIYELRGSYFTCRDILRMDAEAMFKVAHRACPEIALPEGKSHDALFDCYKQVKTLNGLIRILSHAAPRLQML